jgi:hypothetical protein
MPRDPLLDERIIWNGRPQHVATPPIMKAFAAVFLLTALICLALGLAGFGGPRGPMLPFALWCGALGGAAIYGPRIWLSGVEYIVTEHHVIWQRGGFRRTIERGSISFARIFWNPALPGTGDLELVRAVPTGALRRRLALTLVSVAAPDRVWAIVRGAEDVAPTGRGERPLAQRLDVGERVIWSARPHARLSAYIPGSSREWMQLAIAVFLLAAFLRILARAVPALLSLLEHEVALSPFAFGALAFAVLTSALLVLAVAGYLIHTAFLPARLVSRTRYLVTDKRVLIQRANEELHLGRDKIVDVIATPVGAGLRTIFLVLDGPRARALAASGAFGEIQRGPHLRPVLEAVDDAEGVSTILLSRPADLPRAA